MSLLSNWKIYALLSAVFAALTAILAKLSVSELNSDLATFYRTVVILAVAAVAVAIRGEWQSPTSVAGRSLALIALSGVATGLSWLCYFKALQLGPASRVAPIDKLSVVLVVLFSVGVLGETLNWKVAVGALLISAGAVLIAL
jgi:bacterial/archaeal transporter family protein